MVGNIAVSIQGHDKGKAYIIIEEKDGFVYVSDGRLKKVDKPKKKNPRHLQINRSFDPEGLVSRLRESGKIHDHDAVRILNLWKDSISEGKHVKSRCNRN